MATFLSSLISFWTFWEPNTCRKRRVEEDKRRQQEFRMKEEAEKMNQKKNRKMSRKMNQKKKSLRMRY